MVVLRSVGMMKGLSYAQTRRDGMLCLHALSALRTSILLRIIWHRDLCIEMAVLRVRVCMSDMHGVYEAELKRSIGEARL